MFYTYHQDNTGGAFDFDKAAGIGQYVIIEAENYTAANLRAEEIGLYFNGAGDCPCCGHRWDPQWGETGHSKPTLYGDSITTGYVGNKPTGFVHYLDGRIEAFHTEHPYFEPL